LATVTALMHRTDPLVKPGGVVRVTRPEIGMVDVAFRVDPAGYGTLEGGRVRVSAVEDVWAQDAALPLPPGEGTGSSGNPPTAPAMAIGYVASSAIRVALFPSDPTFTIKLWRAASDLGAGVTTGATVLSSTIAGTTLYYDDTQTVGVTKYYAAQLVRAGWTDGPLTAWQAMTAAAGTPTTTPTGTDPTFALSWDDALGTFTVTVTDPDGRLQTVEFRHRSGTGAFTAWTADASAPYTDTVTLDPTYDSRIEARVTYLNTAGDTVTQEFAHDFLVTPVGNATASYATVGDESADLPNSRQLTAGDGIVISDGGPGGALEFALDASADGTGTAVRYLTVEGTLYTATDVLEFPMDMAGTIVEAEIQADASGSAVCDVLKASAGTSLSFASIAASAKPTLSSQQRVVDATLTGWTTAITAGDTLRFAMASLTTATRVTVALKVKVTDTVTVSAPRTYSVVRTLYTSGEVVEVPLDIAGTLAAYTVVGDVSGSATVGLTRATSGGFPSFSDLTGGGNLTLSSAQRHTDTTLSGFTTALAAGDTLKLTLSSVTTCTRVTVCLRIDAAGGASGGATALDDLSDVTITSPANGQALVRRAGVFVNDAIAQADVTSLVTDLAAKAPLASPTFTGTVTIPTPSAADNSTKAASTAYVQGELASYAPKASPTFTGTPAAPTAGAGTNTTQLATTAFVTAAVAAVAAGTPTYVGVRVTNSANQTIATGTATAVTFDTEQYDPNGMHSTVSNTSRLTCQVAGKYHIYGGTFWDANTTGIREWFIRLNGSTILSYLSTNPVGSGGGTSQIISTTYALAVSDYVELLAKQTSGGNLNILARSTEGMHQFGADLLGS
jgi:hypothetical protein